MYVASKNITDKDIIQMIAENRSVGWEYLYEKYSPAMYGLICSLTDNRYIAEKIFVQVFIDIRQTKGIPVTSQALLPFLLRHTWNLATIRLDKMAIQPAPVQFLPGTELVHLLCTASASLETTAHMLQLKPAEVKQRLYEEVCRLRNINKTKDKILA